MGVLVTSLVYSYLTCDINTHNSEAFLVPATTKLNQLSAEI